MKRTITLITLGLMPFLSAGQSKKLLDSTIASNQKGLYVSQAQNLKPLGFIFTEQNKPWFQLHSLPSWNNPNSLIIVIRKSQARWLNDSTLIIKKP